MQDFYITELDTCEIDENNNEIYGVTDIHVFIPDEPLEDNDDINSIGNISLCGEVRALAIEDETLTWLDLIDVKSNYTKKDITCSDCLNLFNQFSGFEE